MRKKNAIKSEIGRKAPRSVETAVAKQLSAGSIGKIVAGISGGADSVAMLHALHSLGVETLAVHCNFHLRGEESDRDMRFVMELCASLGIKLQIIHFDVNEYISRHGGSVEMACRDLRYIEFRKLLKDIGYDRIAVAHNADDQAETLLLNLMRGAGVAGLRGMQPDSGEIIRPLLGVTRREIEDYLRELGSEYIVDSSNLQSDFRRNFLRNEVIPLLETKWPEARKSICRTAANMLQEERVLDRIEASIEGNNSDTLMFTAIDAAPDPLWIIRRWATRHNAGESRAVEIYNTYKKDSAKSGKRWYVTGGRIMMERDRLEYVPDDATATQTKPIEMDCREVKPDKNLMQKVRTESLDVLWTSLPPDELIFRHPSTGDRILPLGMPGSTLLSKIMKDAGLSQFEKEKVIVAEEKSSGIIIWVCGLKRSRLRLVSETAPKAFRYTPLN